MRLSLALILVLMGCVHSKPEAAAPPPPPKSLYERLGGLPAITATVDAFLHNVAADEKINARFASANLPDLRQKLIDQICQATGGPCIYKGRDMISAHKGMNVQAAEFDALVVDLQQALASLKVPDKEQGDLLGALGSMKPQIVDNGSAAIAPDGGR